MRIRGGSGLGDSLYMRPIAEYFAKRGQQVTALSNFPDVFIGSKVGVEPFARNNCHVVAHYVSGKENPDTTQWQDICVAAGASTALRFNWSLTNTALVERIKREAAGRRIILVHGGRTPMARMDGFAMDLLPSKSTFDAVLGGMTDCLSVAIGGDDGICYQPHVDVDLTGKTTVAELLDLAWVCDGVVAQCSFAVPMAECFDKPLLAIWSHRAAGSNQAYIRTITPRKVLSKASSTFAMDDWDNERISEAVNAFRKL